MIKSGLVSITFRQLVPEEIVSLAREAGVAGIEWGGDVHVPHGDLRVAREVGQRTRDAGLEVACYGSYYRAAESEAAGLTFESVLETALALEAPVIRVWAGGRSPGDADAGYRDRVAADTRRIAEQAGAAGVRIAYEYHKKTLTEEPESAVALLDAVAHENVATFWQAPLDVPDEQRTQSLDSVLPHLANVHVFHWIYVDGERQRRPLAEGKSEWIRDLDSIRCLEGSRYALLEFVEDDDPACFLRDAAVLNRWLERKTGDQ